MEQITKKIQYINKDKYIKKTMIRQIKTEISQNVNKNTIQIEKL